MSVTVTVRTLRLVGPESDARATLADSLRDIEGFAVEPVGASEGTEALDGADAIVVVDSPPASDGIEAFRDIRSSGSDVPVVLVGVDVAPDRIERALGEGVTEYVTWDGTDGAELGARIRAHIDNPVLDGTVEARRWRSIIGSLAHDMKNPLNVVAGRLELLDVEDTHTDAVVRSISRVESLLDEVSAVAAATSDAETAGPIDIAASADRVWSRLDTDSASLRVDTTATVDGDPNAMDILLKRVLENAVVHGGEAVTVTVGDAERGCYVADDGPGLPEDGRDRVFEQGYGTAPHGEGYGLFVAERIASANGWVITASESDAGGARFDIQDR